MSDHNNSRIHTGNTDEIEMLDDKARNKSKTAKLYRPKYPTWKENLSYYFSHFCGATSIHGVQYLGERGRLIIEKLVWSIIIVTVWCICLFLITRTYNKWVTSPVIVTFATTETPISEIPFPAVTISPEANADTNIFNYTDVLIKKTLNIQTTAKEDRYFETFSLVCEGLYNTLSGEEMQNKGNLTIETERFNDLESAFPKSLTSILPITWKGKQIPSEHALEGTINNFGLAYTFNMLDYSDLFNNIVDVSSEFLTNGSKTNRWSLDEGYPKKHRGDTYPRRTFVSGVSGGFSFFGAAAINHSKYSCNAPLSGYKVTLHHPCELPNMDKHFRLPLNQVVMVAVKPRMITISDNLKSYSSEARKCYLTNERQLAFFKSYTQDNCEHECILNSTLRECGCLPLYMLIFGDVASLCGPGLMPCVSAIKAHYISNKDDNECKCLPSCTSLEYDVEISQTKEDFNSFFNLMGKLVSRNMSLEIVNSNMRFSALVVYYKEMQFLSSERNELYGYVDFFSNTGGLLGLFIGFSVTSLIEIIYFLTLRLGCNIKMFGKKFWSGEPDLINNENAK